MTVKAFAWVKDKLPVLRLFLVFRQLVKDVFLFNMKHASFSSNADDWESFLVRPHSHHFLDVDMAAGLRTY